MPRFIVKVYKLYRGSIEIDTHKYDTFAEMTRAVNVFKYFRYVYYVEAGELIYVDTDNTYYKEWIKWIRKK